MLSIKRYQSAIQFRKCFLRDGWTVVLHVEALEYFLTKINILSI